MNLPNGWLGTGQTLTVNLSCDIQLRAQVFAGTYSSREARIDNTGLWFEARKSASAVTLLRNDLWTGSTETGSSWDFVDTVLIDDATATETILRTNSGSAGTPAFMDAVPIEKILGPLRLGVTLQDGTLKYSWFADAATHLIYRVDGIQYREIAFSDPPALIRYVYYGPGILAHTVTGQGEQLQFERHVWSNLGSGEVGSSFFSHVKFSNFAWNGNAVSVPFATEYSLLLQTDPDNFFNQGSRVGASFQYRANVVADDTTGAAVAADFTVEGNAGTCPATVDVSEAWVSEFSGDLAPYDDTAQGKILEPAIITTAWANTQTVVPYESDRTFIFAGNDPSAPGSASPTDWTTGDLTIAASVNVLNSSNAWTVDLGTATVGGTPTAPVFTVTAEPVIVKRGLAESWRDWNNSGSGDYEPDDLFTSTKHDLYASGSTDDAWGWSLYGLLGVDLTAPVGPDTEIAVEVTWAILRGTSTVDTIVVNYSPVTFPAGARTTQRVDLLFPVEQTNRPFYGERVDQIRLVGLLNGVTTVHALSLVVDEDAYLGIGGRRAVLVDGTITYTGAVLAQDGSAPSLQWGRDTPVTQSPPFDRDLDGWADYRGDHQNGTFVVNGVGKDWLGKAPGMLSTTLADTFDELSRMEGLTAVYDGTAITAAFTAGGNTIGIDAGGSPATPIRYADWLVPTFPSARIAAGTPYDVRAQLVALGVVIPPGLAPADLIIFERNTLGLVLEALATDANYDRRGVGVTVNARAYTGGAPAAGDTLLAAGTTDASGYVELPVRSGRIAGSEFNAYAIGS